MRVHFGPGYRLYFVRRGRVVVVMLNAGDKSTQKRDIRRALKLAAQLETTYDQTKAPLKLVAFDAARYLDDDEAIAEYMTAVLEANDPDLLLLALGDVARAKGMAQVAKDAASPGKPIQSLAPGAKPRFETVMKVARALGVKFTVQPA